jgi:hypothetical protein
VEALVERVLADTLDTLDGEHASCPPMAPTASSDRGHVVRDASGRAVRMIGAMTDVTDVKRAHRSLMAAHERLQAAAATHLTETRERAALARELHDEFGQLLTAAKLSASSLRSMALEGCSAARQATTREKAANLCDVLDMALHGVRNVATHCGRRPSTSSAGARSKACRADRAPRGPHLRGHDRQGHAGRVFGPKAPPSTAWCRSWRTTSRATRPRRPSGST